ncbi:MAG: LacI family transcriptional regulator [Chloroflexi bacterium]|nr:LacI family transcriptional regulator [Chloroflexota bacterium]
MPEVQKATIYDVAEKAGVSISTVSRVLNTPNRVRESTRQKVYSVIDQLGFIPHAAASARARKGVGRIGVLAPFFTISSFVQRMRGVATALSDTPYELVVYSVDTLDRLKNYLAVLSYSRRLDGLIVMSLPVDEAAAQRLVENKLETVLIEFSHPTISNIVIDDRLGGQLAARYLLSKGHRCCAFVSNRGLPEYSLHPEDQRLAGYRQELLDNGIPLSEEYIKHPQLQRTGLEINIHELLDLPEPPSAIFAATDDLAMRVLKVARERHIRVPQDLAIIGFDNLDVSEYLGLTTVRQPLDESGRLAVEVLLTRLKDPSRSSKSIQLPLTVLERESA